MKKFVVAALLAAGAIGAAQARTNVSLSIGLGGPVYGPAYVQPAPVVYGPGPVVYGSPAPVVYVRPAPVYYGAPGVVYVGPGYYRGHRRYWR